jgi:hypothetical protein
MTKRATELPPDFAELIGAFDAERVEYLLVGGWAVGAHARPRATKDLDLWIDGGENLERVARALARFGAPSALVEASRTLGDAEVLFFGRPPARVDLLRTIAGVSFADAKQRAVRLALGPHPSVPVIGLDDLIMNKRSAGRPQDLADAAALERARDRRRR